MAIFDLATWFTNKALFTILNFIPVFTCGTLIWIATFSAFFNVTLRKTNFVRRKKITFFTSKTFIRSKTFSAMKRFVTIRGALIVAVKVVTLDTLTAYIRT